MLTQYLTRTERLLQNPGAPVSLYAPADLTDYINEARGQIATEAECIRGTTTLSLAIGTREYPFTAITIAAGQGLAGVINVRQAGLVTGTGGMQWLQGRAWEWFFVYRLNAATWGTGPPSEWSQLGQGAGGTLFFDPIPNAAFSVLLDPVYYPIPLVDDTTIEAIPYLWTDAVPFLAAYFALLASQGSARAKDADDMFQRYEVFKQRARKAATASVLPFYYPQQPNPVMANQLGGMPQRQQRGSA